MDMRPFRGFRPHPENAARLSARPYDVMNSSEALEEAAGNPMSLLHITKPEINFEPMCDEHDPRVYAKAKEQYEHFKQEGWLQQDEQAGYYVYAQTMEGRTQYGLVVAAHIDDYLQGRIKKHELTRRDKEEDRMKHIRTLSAHMGPAFFVYKHREDLRAIIAEATQANPTYDFIAAEDGFRHQMWPIWEEDKVQAITRILGEIDTMYIADGHHRSAASALVGAERRAQNPHHTGDEEYNYMLAVCFPDDELRVMDYNRVVRDLNGMTKDELLSRLGEDFEITIDSSKDHRPTRLHEFGLYMDSTWYRLFAKPGRYDDSDPIGVLDVDISSRLILDKQLGITDLRGDKRIDFVGGLRGLSALEERVNSGEMALALALYPVTMQQIMDIADSGNIMPPKATWFEPKLRSGIVIHEF